MEAHLSPTQQVASSNLAVRTTEKSTTPKVVEQAKQQTKNVIKDRDGTTIRVRDHILFLTRGAYPSRRGVVRKVERLWIVAEDSEGREIRRAPSNVRAISAESRILN